MKPIQTADAWKPESTGIFTGLTMQAYLAAPGASRSLLARVADRPSTALQPSESTAAMQWGTLLNDLLLFGTREFYVRPEFYENGDGERKPWNGNATACKTWKKEHSDKPVLPAQGEHSVEWLEKAAGKALADPRVRELLKVCQYREVSIFGRSDDYPFLLKGRPDLLGFDGARVIYADVKTTVSGGTRDFSREILRFGYYKQLALGRQILHNLGYSPVEPYLIIVEKGDAPRVQVRKLVERALDKGDFDLDDEMQIYWRCRNLNQWPDFPDEPEPHITGVIDLPESCYRGQIDDLQGMTEVSEEAAAV